MSGSEQQYFSAKPDSRSAPLPFTLSWNGRDFRFLTDSGVFSKGELDFGSRVLLKALPDEIAGEVLDLGCGWGPVGILTAAFHPQARVTMADVNERAVELARQNARANGVNAQAMLSNGFENLPGPFDLIALNPPIRAGKQVISRLYEGSLEKLSPRGALYVVIRKQQGADSARKYLQSLFPRVETVARKGGYHVLRCNNAA